MCGVLKWTGCAARELCGNRRINSKKRDKEQMCTFGTGTELRRHSTPFSTRLLKNPVSFSETSMGVVTRQKEN